MQTGLDIAQPTNRIMETILRFFKDSILMKILIAVLTFLFSIMSEAQVDRNTELFQNLKKKDSIIFDLSFNRCKISVLDDIISEDLEFYHDTGGITLGKEQFIQSVKNNICSNPNSKPVRELIANSLQVYPLYNNDGKLYGAIQKGDHHFYLKESGKIRPTVSSKFTHLWILKDNKWTLKRVLSYHHQPIQN